MTTSESIQKNYTETYALGEDKNRLAKAAKDFGLAQIRTPQRPIRKTNSEWQDLEETTNDTNMNINIHNRLNSQSILKFGSTVWKDVGLLFLDSTLEAARMHSVGYLAKEEFVFRDGSIHHMSVSKKKKGVQPKYGNLMDLFHRKPLGPENVEVQESDDADYEEIIFEEVEGGTITAAIFGIVKGMVGPAILYLPRGFAISGYCVAIPSMIISTMTYLYSAKRLLQAWKVESMKMALQAEKIDEIEKLIDSVNIGGGRNFYGSIEGEGKVISESSKLVDEPRLLTYPELARRAFGKYSILISGGIAVLQFGVCLTYLIFVPQNLAESTKALGFDVPKQMLLIAMLTLEIPLCWIQDIRKLAPMNVLATLFIAFGLLSVLYLALFYNDDGTSDVNKNLLEEIAHLPSIKDTWFLFIGTSFFCFEGSITLLIPLQESLHSLEDKKKFPIVNKKVISCTVLFYLFFAVICWASFGNKVQTALTASLPLGLLSTIIQLTYSIAVIFTFPLQAFPALQVVTNAHSTKRGGNKSTDKSWTRMRQKLTASLMICILGIIAVFAIDYLGNVVSLLGSLVGIPITLVFPPLIHNQLVENSTHSTRTMNYCLSIIGLLAACAVSFTTITGWNEGAEGG